MQKKSLPSESLMKIVGPNFNKNQNYLFRIHETFAENEKYSTFH